MTFMVIVRQVVTSMVSGIKLKLILMDHQLLMMFVLLVILLDMLLIMWLTPILGLVFVFSNFTLVFILVRILETIPMLMILGHSIPPSPQYSTISPSTKTSKTESSPNKQVTSSSTTSQLPRTTTAVSNST